QRQVGHRGKRVDPLRRPAPDLAVSITRFAEFFQRLLEQAQVHAVYGAIAMRLAKFLANAGVASRRRAEEIVRSGRVTVAGATVADPARAVTSDQAVAVDGDRVREPLSRVVYAVNKPYGVVSTARDPQ